MPVITLADVKPKAGIALSDESQDVALQGILVGVRQFIADQTGMDDVATAHTDIREQCQIGRHYELDHRPIDITRTVAAQGRTHSGVTSVRWLDLVADVVDARKGRVVLLGVSNFFQSFPPIEPPNPIFRWQQPIWPVVQFLYTTEATVWPADLSDAAAAFVAFLHRYQQNNHLASASLGPISESYRQIDSIPLNIRDTISRYSLKRVLWTA